MKSIFTSMIFSYFRTFDFDMMIVTDKGSFSFEYHEILRRVYEAITKHSQIVGTSTIWWGMYSIQLLPSFLLK